MPMVSTFGVIPHYFERRNPVAYAGIGLGTGIGLAAEPSITAAALDIFGFRNGLLCLSVQFVIPVISNVIFKPQQMPKEQRIGSTRQLCASYNQSWKHFVTGFLIVNLALAIGARASVDILTFGYMTKYFSSSVAILAYSIFGISFFGCNTYIFTLYALKFKANYFILHLTTSMMHGVVVCILPLISNPINLYIVIAIIGGITGAVFGFKGNLLAHLYPTKDIAHKYGLTEAAGGLGALTIPLCAGYIESTFGHGVSFYFIGACMIFSSIVLGSAALIRPKLWTECSKQCFSRDNVESEEHDVQKDQKSTS